MPILTISASKKQKQRLRNGHKVRLKKAMKGKGICMIVKPESYNLAMRSFGKNKGVEIRLDPQEILANRENIDFDMSPEAFNKLKSKPEETEVAEGKGLFDDIKRGVSKGSKQVGRAAKKGSKQLGRFARTEGKEFLEDVALDVAREGVNFAKETLPEIMATAGATAGATAAVAVGQPQFAPGAAQVLGQIGYSLGDYSTAKAERVLDKQERKTMRARQPRNRQSSTIQQNRINLTDQISLNNSLQDLNKQLGTNYGFQTSSALGRLEASTMNQNFLQQKIMDLTAENDGYGLRKSFDDVNPQMRFKSRFEGNPLTIGYGLYAGRGLYAGGGHCSGDGLYASQRRTMNGGQVGAKGQEVRDKSLKSTYDVNFHYKNQFPPAYQNLGKKQ